MSNSCLPKNFEAKIIFHKIDWIRFGVCFDKKILKNQVDQNCPPFDIFYLIEDLNQLYLYNNWVNYFKGQVELKSGDTVIISMHNEELRFNVNGVDLGKGVASAWHVVRKCTCSFIQET